MNRAGLVSRERERPARFKTKRVFSFFALALPMLAVALLQITEVRGNVAPYVPRNAIEEGTYDNERLRTDKIEDDGERENEGSSVYLKISPIFDATRSHAGEYNTSRGEKRTMNRTRFKRGVVHLYNMVVCATGCNPLSYKGYGCYCGFLGSGYVIDGIDRCCKMHDWCYDATDCPVFMEYFVPYYWRCYRGNKPVCAVEHGNWGGSGSCAQRLCECDRSLAECLRRYPCPTTKAVCTSSPWRLVQNLFMIM